MKNRLIPVLSLFIALVGLSACTNTIDGAGKDMERAGEKIQRSVNN